VALLYRSTPRFPTSLGVSKWLARDPLPNAERLQGMNLYQYVGNNPVNLVDPLGLKTCWKNVLMTHYGDLPGDKVGNHDNKLKSGDIAVGYNGPGPMPKSTSTPVLPIGTSVNIYPRNGTPIQGTVNDIGNFDKVHPEQVQGPGDWIDIWDPKKSRQKRTDNGWISIEVKDCQDCPAGWSG
jgi:uncharacterized protein RhaS with RHS repeats